MKIPRLVKPAQYEEYQHLKGRYERDLLFESINSVSLEFDIDEPVRTCVMALALLGCNPYFSCCGFDYYGQPIHKSHSYGVLYFGMEGNTENNAVLSELFASNIFLKDTWTSNYTINDGIPTVWLSTKFSRKEQWNSEDSIHFSELAVTRTHYLQMFLMSLQDRMKDEFLLKDGNAIYHHRFRFWQYPPKEPWLITKTALLDRVSP